MKLLKSIIFLAIIFLSGTYINGQTDIISAEELKSLMKENADFVIIDANKSKGYKAAHIKGAIHLDHNDLYLPGDIKGLIKSPEELAEIFGGLGIGDDKMVVITDDGSHKYSTRVYWILKYLGYDNMKLLHKNMDDWRSVRLELTGKAGVPKPANFVVTLRPEIFVGILEVENAQNNDQIILIDARTPEEFVGNHKNSEGHIPGAININYEELLTENGAFKSVAELKSIADKYGLTPEKELIFYCRTSVRAGVPFFAFTNILNYPNVKVYDGAYFEWSSIRDVIQ